MIIIHIHKYGNTMRQLVDDFKTYEEAVEACRRFIKRKSVAHVSLRIQYYDKKNDEYVKIVQKFFKDKWEDM